MRHIATFRRTAPWLAVMSAALLASLGLAQQQTKKDPAPAGSAQAVADAKGQFFESQVKPILKENCWKCHRGKKPKAGLRLTSRKSIVAGGESGPAIDVKQPEESLLLDAINYKTYEMPPKGRLPAKQIEILTRWVRQGAVWAGSSEEQADGETDVEDEHGPPRVTAEARKFWSFVPVQRPELPQVKNSQWVRQRLDTFVMSKLEAAKLAPNPPAARSDLLRRAYYDLTGLPPTPAQTAAFLADKSPVAFEKVIDQLLESPQYGEKWGRHWLDLVRYAETNSYERDGAKPFVWRYRDYVIRSFNDDKPYDQFLREQLAGDEAQPMTRDSLIATGYYRLGIWQDEPVDPVQELYEDLDDLVETTGQVFLGLTLNCCRCHDHKLDPLPQRDYYRFMSFFHGLNRFGVRGGDSVAKFSVRPLPAVTEADRQRQAAAEQRRAAELKKLRAEMSEIEETVRASLTPVQRQDFEYEQNRLPIIRKHAAKLLGPKLKHYMQLNRQFRKLQNTPPRLAGEALCVTEIGAKPRDTFVLIRGNAHVRGPQVSPGFPQVLGFADPVIPTPAAGATTSGRRSALAAWIASGKNPLTARVMANRIWQYHFGRGIVRSPNNFGFKGDAPTHPGLLDYLAAELVDGGWRIKRMHKLIMLSNTYQMSSQARPEGLAKDPENKLLWRFEMRRLQAEELRDSMLAVNGALNLQQFGPSIFTLIPAEVKAGQSRPGAGWGESPLDQRNRRSIYVHVKRSLIVPMMAAFDGPDPDATCAQRFVTTQPTQSLELFNGEFAQRQARVLAEFLQKTAGEEPESQVRLALNRAWQRTPSQADVDRGTELMRRLQQEHKLSATAALERFCLVVFNMNEFLYLD